MRSAWALGSICSLLLIPVSILFSTFSLPTFSIHRKDTSFPIDFRCSLSLLFSFLLYPLSFSFSLLFFPVTALLSPFLPSSLIAFSFLSLKEPALPFSLPFLSLFFPGGLRKQFSTIYEKKRRSTHIWSIHFKFSLLALRMPS